MQFKYRAFSQKNGNWLLVSTNETKLQPKIYVKNMAKNEEKLPRNANYCF